MPKLGPKQDEIGAATAAGIESVAPALSAFNLPDYGGEGGEVLTRGTSVGRYLVLERLGAGAMGVVYAAYDQELDRKIAIKLLRPRDGQGDEAKRRERLIREAKAIAKLSHQNVVGIFDVGVHDGHVFLAMEHLGGGTLRDWLAAKKRPWREIVRMFIDVGQGLAAAHAEGLIHRDFKPDNVLLDKQGKPKVADFGLVRLGSAEPDPPTDAIDAAEITYEEDGVDSPPGATPHGPLTRTGAIAGTPAYMAPEQFLGKPIDARTDQFAFCVALYEALYGDRPFAGKTVMALAGAVLRGRVKDTPRDSIVPAWVRRTTARGLHSDADRRHPTMEDLLRALANDPILRIRRRVGFGSAVGMVVAALFLLYRRSEHRRADLEQQVSQTITAAGKAVSVARDAGDRARGLSVAALQMFDDKRREEGELTWKEARAQNAAADAALERAEHDLVAALALDPARDLTRVQLGDVLYERALLAETEHRKQDLTRHLARIAEIDRRGTVRARWDRPGSLKLDVDPADTLVIVERYTEQPDGRRRATPFPDAPCAAGAPCSLSPGSYRLRLRAPGRPEVLLPVLMGRGEAVTRAVRVPATIPGGFAFIPSGRFIFGDYDEGMRTSFLKTVPAHEVESDSYLISKTEVTYADWILFLDQLSATERRQFLPDATEKKMASLQGTVRLSPISGGRWRLDVEPVDTKYAAESGQLVRYSGRHTNSAQDWLKFPVSGISGEQMNGYLAWLRRSGRLPGARLCSEREWERAARGADDRVFPHGDTLLADDANHDVTYGRVASAFGPDAVGLHPSSKSPFDVDDLVGNVWELVTSSVEQGGHAIRGGGYYFFHMNGRITNREPFDSDARSVHIGLRVCADKGE